MRDAFKVGAAVGSGATARAAQLGGADFLLAINAGRMRSMGAPSIASMLPLADAATDSLAFAEREVLPQATAPTYVGLCLWSAAHDAAHLARLVMEAGFAGAVNFPSIMLYAPQMRRVLERHGLGVAAEIALLRAVQRLGGRGLFYCDGPADARAAAEAGVDAVIQNFGWNIGGAVGHQSEVSLERAAHVARDVARAARAARPGVEVFLEGGPILTGQDLTFVTNHADLDGYVGGSTIDRFPVETSVANQIAVYRAAATRPAVQTQATTAALREAAGFGLLGRSPAFAAFAAALARAKEATAPVVLTGPEGVDLPAALEWLLSAAPREERRFFDFADTPSAHQANDALFGRAGPRRRALGVLAEGAATVVLLNCQRAPKLVENKLAATLQSGRVQAVGGHRRTPLTSRLIMLAAEPTEFGDFGVGEIRLAFPSLRAREGDVPLILDATLRRFGQEGRRPDIRPAAQRVVAAHDWPGEDAQLRRFASRLMAPGAPAVYEAHDIAKLLRGAPPRPAEGSAADAMRERVLQALTRHDFRMGETAAALNISRKTLYNRMKRLGLR